MTKPFFRTAALAAACLALLPPAFAQQIASGARGRAEGLRAMDAAHFHGHWNSRTRDARDAHARVGVYLSSPF
jgi:hypothetical protein